MQRGNPRPKCNWQTQIILRLSQQPIKLIVPTALKWELVQQSTLNSPVGKQRGPIGRSEEYRQRDFVFGIIFSKYYLLNNNIYDRHSILRITMIKPKILESRLLGEESKMKPHLWNDSSEISDETLSVFEGYRRTGSLQVANRPNALLSLVNLLNLSLVITKLLGKCY